MIGAMLFHSDSIADAKKFLTIDDQMCLSYKNSQKKDDAEKDLQLSTEQSQLMEQFTLIGRQLNMVLLNMRNRLDGQKRFIYCIKDTIEVA